MHKIRILIVMAGLVVSGLMAFPLQKEAVFRFGGVSSRARLELVDSFASGCRNERPNDS